MGTTALSVIPTYSDTVLIMKYDLSDDTDFSTVSSTFHWLKKEFPYHKVIAIPTDMELLSCSKKSTIALLKDLISELEGVSNNE